MWTEGRKYAGAAEDIGVSWPVVINVPLNLHNAGLKVIVKNSGLYMALIALNRYIFVWGLQIYLNMPGTMLWVERNLFA